MKHVVVGLLALASLSVFHSHARGAEAEEAGKPIEATVNFGYVQTGGNTDVVTMLASDKFEWKRNAWGFSQDGEAVYGKDGDTENAGRYGLGLRANYALAARVSLYGLTGFKRNVYAGIEHQFDEGVGAALHVILAKPQLLDFELGFGLLQRRTTAAVDEDFSTARVAALYKYYFTEKATFEATGDWVVNLEDTEDSDFDARAAVAAPLAGGLSINLGYNAQYRNRPLPGLERLDWTVSSGLQFSF